MPRTTIRVEVPTASPDDLVALIEALLAQHDKLEAAKSGSSPLPAADVTKLRAIVTQAKPDRAKAKDFDRQAQALYESSSKLLGLGTGQNSRTEGTGLSLTVKMRDLLLALNRGSENALEPWGFTVVVGSAAAPKKKAPAA